MSWASLSEVLGGAGTCLLPPLCLCVRRYSHARPGPPCPPILQCQRPPPGRLPAPPRHMLWAQGPRRGRDPVAGSGCLLRARAWRGRPPPHLSSHFPTGMTPQTSCLHGTLVLGSASGDPSPRAPPSRQWVCQVLGAGHWHGGWEPWRAGSPPDPQGLCPQGLTRLPEGFWARLPRELSWLHLPSLQGSHAAASWKPAQLVLSLTLLQPVACFCLSFQGPRFVRLQSELPQKPPHLVPSPGPSFVSLPSSTSWRTPVPLSNPGEHHLFLGNPTEATVLPREVTVVPGEATVLPGAPAGAGASSQGMDTSPPAYWLVSRSPRAGPAQSPREHRGAGLSRSGWTQDACR